MKARAKTKYPKSKTKRSSKRRVLACKKSIPIPIRIISNSPSASVRFFTFFKNSMLKLTILYLIIGLNWAGIYAVGNTLAHFLDPENSSDDTFTAGTLDFSLTAGSWSAYPSDTAGLLPGDTVSKTISLNQLGSLGFKYDVIAAYTSGNSSFCDALDVVAKRNSVQLYSGSLLGLTVTPQTFVSSIVDSWVFDVSLPIEESAYPAESCGFKFVFTGWQTNLPNASSGFSDTEEDSNTLMGALGQACTPQNVNLPTNFDIENWKDHAKEGGRVEGSFVFPSGTTGLLLGPTEIMGNLTFGQNNGATIKGPIYVHGNLSIGAGTTITQDNSFGNNFVAIIVEGTINIADNVVFIGSGTIGAVLLVSKAPAGSTVIDILDGTIANGNLGDAVLFALNGNIHIGDNRTVLDAFVVTEGSSGSVGPLSPSASANVDNSSGVSWSNLTNVYVSDDSYATVTIGSSGHSDYLQTTGFGFSIPDSSTVAGIELRVERKVTTASEVSDNTVRLIKNSVIVGNNKASGTQWGTTETTVTYGDSSDLWGTTWTPSDINNANFGAVFAAEHDWLDTDTVSVDYISIKVYWAIAGQTITLDTGATIQHGTLPSQAACGPMFMDLNQVVINEFVPNVPDTGISTTIFSDSFGTGDTDSTFDEAPAWTEGGAGAEKRAAGSGNDSASTDGGRFAAMYGDDGRICIQINTSAYNTVLMSYYWRGDSDAEDGEYGSVQYRIGSCSGSDSWTTAASHELDDGDTGNTSWVQNTGVSLPSNSTLAIRFRVYSNQSNEEFRIDGVTITGEIPAGSYNTGLMSPAANVQNGSGDDWDNPSNAYADGGGAATDNEGERHRYYNFGFNIPTMVTIDGIEVRADAWSTVGATSFFSDSFGTGDTDTTFDETPVWTEGGLGAEKRAYSGSGNDSASPDGGRFAIIFSDDSDTNGWICRTIDATGYNSLQLSYYWRGDSDADSSNDDGVVEYKIGGTCSDGNDGTGWTNLQNHDLRNDSSWYTQSAFTLPSNTNNTSFLLRFRTHNAEDGEYFRVDGVSISSMPSSSGCQLGVDLSWDNGANWTSEKTQTLTGTEATYILGSSSDTWGYAWQASEFSNFRARVRDIDPGSSCADSATTNLDWLPVKVYYSISGDAGNPGEPHDGEWIELYNGTGSTVGVDGWALYDAENTHELLITAANTDTGGTMIPAGGFLVVYRDGDADFDLDNTADRVRLYDDQITTGGTQVDFHIYNYGGLIPENKSFARIPDGTANWVDPEPTPGKPNSFFVEPYTEPIEPEPLAEEPLIEETEIVETKTDEITPENLVEDLLNFVEDILNQETENNIETPTSDETAAADETPAVEETSATDEAVVPEVVPASEENSANTEDTTITEDTVIIEEPVEIQNDDTVPVIEQQPAIEQEPVIVPDNDNSNPDSATPPADSDSGSGSESSSDGGSGDSAATPSE